MLIPVPPHVQGVGEIGELKAELAKALVATDEALQKTDKGYPQEMQIGHYFPRGGNLA
jgi:hypothetical protein